MESKHLRAILNRQSFNVVSVRLHVSKGGCVVITAIRVGVAILQVLKAVVLLECYQQTATIIVVSDTTTVVDMSGHIDKGLPWDLVLLVKEKLQHDERCFHIRIIELVENVPTKGTELTSFLDNSVEEGQTEDKLAPLFCLLAIVEVLV
jgi:hypothetical protein